MCIASHDAPAVIDPDLAPSVQVGGLIRGWVGADPSKLRRREVLVCQVCSDDRPVFGGQDRRAAAYGRAVVYRVEVDALVDTGAIRPRRVGHQLIALR